MKNGLRTLCRTGFFILHSAFFIQLVYVYRTTALAFPSVVPTSHLPHGPERTGSLSDFRRRTYPGSNPLGVRVAGKV